MFASFLSKGIGADVATTSDTTHVSTSASRASRQRFSTGHDHRSANGYVDSDLSLLRPES